MTQAKETKAQLQHRLVLLANELRQTKEQIKQLHEAHAAERARQCTALFALKVFTPEFSETVHTTDGEPPRVVTADAQPGLSEHDMGMLRAAAALGKEIRIRYKAPNAGLFFSSSRDNDHAPEFVFTIEAR